MKTTLRIGQLCLLSLLLFVAACNKSTDPGVQENLQSSTDNAIIDAEFSTIFSLATAQADVSTGTIIDKRGVEIQSPPNAKCDQLPDCATVVYDSVARTISIDFGSVNCLCKDGLQRRGKVVISVTGTWKTIGSSVNLTLIDYYVEDMRVTGSKTISILAANSFNVLVTGASIQTPTGTISWNSTRTIKQTKGFLTRNIALDDEFEISGNSSGINRQGVGFSVVINETKPLVRRLICVLKAFVSGIITIRNEAGSTLSVNYDPDGTMGCNKNALVTVNGKEYTIKLR